MARPKKAPVKRGRKPAADKAVAAKSAEAVPAVVASAV